VALLHLAARLQSQLSLPVSIDLRRNVLQTLTISLATYHTSLLFFRAWTSSLYFGLSGIHQVIPAWFFVLHQDIPVILLSFIETFFLHRDTLPSSRYSSFIEILFLHRDITVLPWVYQALLDPSLLIFFQHQVIPDLFFFSHHGSTRWGRDL